MKILKLILGCAAFSLATSCGHLPNASTYAYFNNTVIPHMEFRAANILEVIDVLNDPDGDGIPQENAQSIILLLPDGHCTNLLTLDMQGASLTDIIRVVAKRLDCKFYIRNGQAYLEPRNPSPVLTPKDDVPEGDPFANRSNKTLEATSQ